MLSGGNDLQEQADGWASAPMRNEVLSLSEVLKIPSERSDELFLWIHPEERTERVI